jgi:hypothetical protein
MCGGGMKVYYGLPKWFIKQFTVPENISLLNVARCKHYIGTGFDAKKKTWTDGVFLTDFEFGLEYWEQQAKKADFIVHFDKEYRHDRE